MEDKKNIAMARSRGLVVRAEDSRTYYQEDVGSIPDTVYWMDVSVASYYIERKLIKVAKCSTPKKIFKKKEPMVITNKIFSPKSMYNT